MVQPERIHGLKEGLRWRWRPTRTRSTAGPLGPQAEMPFCRRQVRGRIERRVVGAVLQRGGPISVCGRRSPGTPHKTMDGDALPCILSAYRTGVCDSTCMACHFSPRMTESRLFARKMALSGKTVKVSMAGKSSIMSAIHLGW